MSLNCVLNKSFLKYYSIPFKTTSDNRSFFQTCHILRQQLSYILRVHNIFAAHEYNYTNVSTLQKGHWHQQRRSKKVITKKQHEPNTVAFNFHFRFHWGILFMSFDLYLIILGWWWKFKWKIHMYMYVCKSGVDLRLECIFGKTNWELTLIMGVPHGTVWNMY